MGIRRNKTILEQAADYVDAVVEAASEKAGPVITDALDKAGPMVADAKDKAGPIVADARDKATPLLAAGVAAAAAQASHVADFASEKAADLKGEPKKKHRLRKLLLITGVAALLAFVAKKLTSGGDQDNWQSSYTPSPPPGSTSSDTPIFDAASAASDEPTANDEGGAGPDEALADAAEEAHPVTTPDEPADVVEVAPGEEPSAKS